MQMGRNLLLKNLTSGPRHGRNFNMNHGQLETSILPTSLSHFALPVQFDAQPFDSWGFVVTPQENLVP